MPYAIDTHCHLHLMPEKVRGAVIERALKNNVRKLVNVACTLNEVGQCLPLADEYDFIWTTAGIHPTELGENMERDLEQVFEYAKNEEKVVAIGEIGLDYYHDKFPHDLQFFYFIGQLNIAKQLNLPAVIHTRAGKYAGDNESAYADMIEILKEGKFSNGVMHCFSGNKEEAKKLLELGMYLSFTGIVTYERNEELREIIKMTPWNRLMMETDSPFLTPQAHRGKKNEPAFVMEVAKTIAEVKGVELEKVLGETTRNAERFFGI